MSNFSIVLSLLLLASVLSVDRSKFRTCDDSSFCRNFRYLERQDRNRYVLQYPTMKFECENCSYQQAKERKQSSKISGIVGKPGKGTSHVQLEQYEASGLQLEIFITNTQSIRVRITEETERWQVILLYSILYLYFL